MVWRTSDWDNVEDKHWEMTEEDTDDEFDDIALSRLGINVSDHANREYHEPVDDVCEECGEHVTECMCERCYGCEMHYDDCICDHGDYYDEYCDSCGNHLSGCNCEY